MEAALIGLLLSLLAPAAVGSLCVWWAWPARGHGAGPSVSHEVLVLRGSLALGLGLGLSSSFLFLWGLAFGVGLVSLVAGDVALVVGLLAVRRVLRSTGGTAAEPGEPAAGTPPDSGGAWSRVAGIAALVGVGVFVAVTARHPHGDGDALAIWNMRARFLHDSWGQWDLVFLAKALAHVDYPLLLPGLVARGWAYSGVVDVAAPAVLGFLFTCATAGVVWGGLALLRGKVAAALGVLALLGTPFLVKHGADQTADIPLAFFMLSGVALYMLHRRGAGDEAPDASGGRSRGAGLLGLCGVSLGCAAWTKNEGALWTLILGAGIVAAELLRLRRGTSNRRDLAALGLGAALPCVAVLWFKLQFGVGNDLLESQSFDGLIDRLFDADRRSEVWEAFRSRLWRLSMEGEHFGWSYALLLGYALLVGRDRRYPVPWLPCAALLAMGLCYFGVFAAGTPYDLDWHLRTTVGRLLLQLWPATLLVAFAVLWTPARRWSDGLWLGVGAFVCYVLLWQTTFFKSDGLFILARLQAGSVVFNNHFLFMPVLAGVTGLLGGLGLGDREAALLLSSAGSAVGVILAYASASALGMPRARAWLVGLLVGLTPPVLFFATVVEFHGLFLAFAQLAFFLAVKLGQRPSWGRAVAVGLAGALAFGFHTSALLLPALLLPWFLGARRDGGSPWSRTDFALVGVAGLVHLGGIWVLLRVLQDGFGFPEFPPSYDQGKLASTLQTLPFAAEMFWQEWLQPYLPVSIAALLTVCVARVRYRMLGFVCGLLAFFFLCLVLLVGRPENGAYLIPLALPAALLVVDAFPPLAVAALLVLCAGWSARQVAEHDVSGPRYDALAASVEAVAGDQPRVLLVADEIELGACLTRMPAMARWVIAEQAKLDPAAVGAHPEGVRAGLLGALKLHWGAGRQVLLSRHGEAFLEESTPSGTLILAALRAVCTVEDVTAEGFDGYRLTSR